METDGAARRNHDFANEHDDRANSTHHGKPHHIGPGQVKAVFGSVAEVLATDGNLNVGLGVDEPYDALDAAQAALDALCRVLQTAVVSPTRLSLLFEELHYQLKELYYCNQQGSDSQ